MDKTALLIAHGSREESANEEVHALAAQLAERSKQRVAVAFLDPIAAPNIPDVIDQLIAQGHRHLVVIPYFLNAGIHVQQDIPNIIRSKQSQYPESHIELKEHIGASTRMLELLQKLFIS